MVYLLLNLFLVATPFVPPNSDWNADGYPYYAFPLVGTGVLLLGAVYWLVWARKAGLPTLDGYGAVAEPEMVVVVTEDGDDAEEINKRLASEGQAAADEVRELLLGRERSQQCAYGSVGG